jgi:hypothetical protein
VEQGIVAHRHIGSRADRVLGLERLRRVMRLVVAVLLINRNEWSTALQTALGIEKASSGADPFSLGDPVITPCVLEAAGFAEVGFEDVHEPVFYGSNVETALAIVLSMRFVADAWRR